MHSPLTFLPEIELHVEADLLMQFVLDVDSFQVHFLEILHILSHPHKNPYVLGSPLLFLQQFLEDLADLLII
jgi:hypothetical protein